MISVFYDQRCIACETVCQRKDWNNISKPFESECASIFRNNNYYFTVLNRKQKKEEELVPFMKEMSL